jgi:soluble lytic murein transglycosylase
VLGSRLEQQRNQFLLAEKLLEKKADRAFLAASETLRDYPLYPYLYYQWLKDHLEQSDRISAFLLHYADTRYADLLKTKWLHYLARKERWLDFLQNYQPSDNTSLRCQYYWASYKTGQSLLALNEAKNLWLTGDSLPEECEPLLTALTLSPLLTSELIWQRFELALMKDNQALADYVQRFMDKSDQLTAALWLQVHNRPQLIQDSSFKQKSDKRLGRIFAHGVDRMAKESPDLALLIWDSEKTYFAIEPAIANKIERRLGIALGVKKDIRAYSRLGQLPGLDPELREWKVRSALLEQNWQHVAEALNGLTPEEQQETRWQYWQARTLRNNQGDTQAAQTIFNNLSEDRSIYGLLAAKAVNKPFKVIDRPVNLAANELETLAQDKDFLTVKELDVLNRKMEMQRQWWYAIKKLSREKRMTAAKLAQYWRWDQIAIITLVKADYWDDLSIRFPINHLLPVQANAERQDLDPAVILGLIRQESMLDINAKSSVGALGLMQIMPKTGKQIALELNEKWQSEDKLYNPDVNLRYGAYYFKQLLNRFNGHFALAVAAYNAGPTRVSKWLPSILPVAADIWIETIPFKETRKYVMSVLSYTLIYQYRIHSNQLNINHLLPDIQPG